MPNLYKSIGSVGLGYPDIGQTFYLVDTDYRSAVQGWTQSDHTGPLDLFGEKNPGRVFYGAGAAAGTGTGNQYASDALALQAGIDAMVDFRGDALFFTPGSYSIATVRTIDVPDARWLGPVVSHPKLARVTLTNTIASAYTMTAAADRMEVAYLRFVPLTAAITWSVPANVDNCHFHHFFYDTNGIAASTATIFATMAGTTNDHWTFSDFYALTDGAQGPLLSMTGTYRALTIRDFVWDHEAGTLATCLLLDASAGDAGGPGPVNIMNGRGNLAAGATAVTNLVALTDAGTDIQWVTVNNFRSSIGFCAAGGLISLSAGSGNTAEAAETGIANSFLDVVGAGAGGAGTAFTQ